MRFLDLIDKERHHEAWHAFGMQVRHRWLLALASAFVGFGVLDDDLGPAALGASLALAIVAFVLPDLWLRRRRATWIDHLELALDRESYANALDGKSFYARLRLVIEGEHLHVGDIYGVVAHVIEATDTRVVIDSFTMQVGLRLLRYPTYNLELHRWFVLLTERVLGPMAKTGRIERITAVHVEASHPALPAAVRR